MLYKYYVIPNKRQVICVTYFEDKLIKARATCSAADTFDENYGKTLAKARVDEKVITKKLKHKTKEITNLLSQYPELMDNWLKHVNKQMDIHASLAKSLQQCQDTINELSSNSNK